MKKRRARRKSIIHTKPKRITVSLKDYQYALVRTIAIHSGCSMSEVMREFIYMPSDLPIAAMIKIFRDRYHKKYNLEE